MRWPSPSPRHLFRRWAARRHPPQRGPLTINRRRIYILPTRVGALFALLLLVMLLGATNYSNSLMFILTFTLVGLGLVCMHHTHRNLVNLELSPQRTEAVFAGSDALFPIRIRNPSRMTRYAIRLADQSATAPAADIAPQDDAELRLAVAAQRRGRLPAPRFSVETTFPLGLFRAWSYAPLEAWCWVYPRPDAVRDLPPRRPEGSAQRGALQPGEEEFHSLRDYRPGDPIRRLHWKTLAREGQPMIKLFAAPGAQTLWLDWQRLPAMDDEMRLSRLCRWVLEADRLGHIYGLRLPGRVIEPGSGADHQRRCLEALALHPQAEAR